MSDDKLRENKYTISTFLISKIWPTLPDKIQMKLKLDEIFLDESFPKRYKSLFSWHLQ